MDAANHDFLITSQHKSFADRQKNLFAELDKITNNLPQNETEHMDITDVPTPDDKTQRKTKHYRGKESIFKRPQAPISKCLPHSKRPAFKRNPTKWIKYSLEDVKDEDISEKGNTAAALSFLKELQDRNKEIVESYNDRPNKIKFQKTSLIRREEEDNETKRTFKNSKLLMPEYVVGQKVRKERRSKEKCDPAPTSKLVLNHLLEEEDDQVD